MARDFIVKLKRGLYVRKQPIFDDATLIGQPPYLSLKAGQHFLSEVTRKLDGYTWAKNASNQWIPIANGRNAYVVDGDNPLKPI